MVRNFFHFKIAGSLDDVIFLKIWNCSSSFQSQTICAQLHRKLGSVLQYELTSHQGALQFAKQFENDEIFFVLYHRWLIFASKFQSFTNVSEKNPTCDLLTLQSWIFRKEFENTDDNFSYHRIPLTFLQNFCWSMITFEFFLANVGL